KVGRTAGGAVRRGGQQAGQPVGSAADEEADRNDPAPVLAVGQVTGVLEAGGVDEREEMETPAIDPVEAVGRMEEALPVHLLLRIGSDEGCEERQSVEAREQYTAGHAE